MNFQDLTGRKFNKLEVIKRVYKENNKQAYWLCKCECGNTTITTTGHLKENHTKSCGCIQKEKAKKLLTTHGLTNTKLFKVWCGIKDRTVRPNNKQYKNYGGRGIKLCKEWLNSFENFYNWSINNRL